MWVLNETKRNWLKDNHKSLSLTKESSNTPFGCWLGWLECTNLSYSRLPWSSYSLNYCCELLFGKKARSSTGVLLLWSRDGKSWYITPCRSVICSSERIASSSSSFAEFYKSFALVAVLVLGCCTLPGKVAEFNCIEGWSCLASDAKVLVRAFLHLIFPLSSRLRSEMISFSKPKLWPY